jgi:hypothetical protein
MSVTGTYITDPILAEYTDEAVERAGLDLQEITGQHLISIRRSVGFVLARWANKGGRQWTFEQVDHQTTVGEVEFDLPVGTIQVQTAVLRRATGAASVATDTEMYPISRSDYLIIHDKNLVGRPDRYFVDRRRDTPSGANPVRILYWLAAENDTDRIIMNVWKQIQDPGNAQNTIDIPFRFQEAFVAALSAKIAQKWKPERFVALVTESEVLFKEADDEDADTAPMVISVNYDRFYGRR